MSPMRAALGEVVDTIEAIRIAKVQDVAWGVAEREMRMAGRRFEARQALGAQWIARDRIESLRCRLPERFAARFVGR